MDIAVEPPLGVGDIQFGEEFTAVADRLRSLGDLRVASPAPGRTAFKSTLVLPDFEITLLMDDGVHVTAVEVWRFENDAAEVHVHYGDLDLFRTPARELAARIEEMGNASVSPDEEVTIFPELSLLLSRETSREVPLDETDGLPLYAHYVLAAPAGYFD
ncbi:hypothetical protein ABZ027_35300 [Streptomyces sp. NPDC006332]|uniref:hypothetical protein n=1 Tax=Streptomyces sp. NPDC006332 TaxID=3155456 RepID=UPI0033A54F3C